MSRLNLEYNPKIAVVIPCYNVKKYILSVLDQIGAEVDEIYVIDDCCPQGTGQYVEDNFKDHRVQVIYHQKNQGVGGAVITGYRQALLNQATVVVKIDGDGQMNPALIPRFIEPILAQEADYTKGNRFYYPADLEEMPALRLIGNACLSFLTKFSSGYWDLFDPTNGYTAIHVKLLEILPLNKISKNYFFESDLLFRLNTIRAVVLDIPMRASYQFEESNLSILKILVPFTFGHLKNLTKRIFYNYYLRNFSLASLNLLLALLLIAFGGIFGAYTWIKSIKTGYPATAGTVMLASLPVILGFQLLLSFLSYDMSLIPRVPLIRKFRFPR